MMEVKGGGRRDLDVAYNLRSFFLAQTRVRILKASHPIQVLRVHVLLQIRELRRIVGIGLLACHGSHGAHQLELDGFTIATLQGVLHTGERETSEWHIVDDTSGGIEASL